MPGPTTDSLRAASVVLRQRYDRGAHPELSRAALDHLCGVLEDTALGRVTDGLRAEAEALAHRIVDDDRPQDALMWRAAAGP